MALFLDPGSGSGFRPSGLPDTILGDVKGIHISKEQAKSLIRAIRTEGKKKQLEIGTADFLDLLYLMGAGQLSKEDIVESSRYRTLSRDDIRNWVWLSDTKEIITARRLNRLDEEKDDAMLVSGPQYACPVPECKNDQNNRLWSMQVRSRDEGTTTFLVCSNCATKSVL